MSTQTFFSYPHNTTVAGASALWIQGLSNAIKACGFVRMAGSRAEIASGPNAGASDFSAVANFSAINTTPEWEIWRFNDTLHGTTLPIYFKLMYGAAGSIALCRINITVGPSWDGVSAITGQSFAARNMDIASSSSVLAMCHVSGDATQGRLAVALWADNDVAIGNAFIVFGIERLHNSDGSDNDEGFWVMCFQSATTASPVNQVISRAAFGGNPLAETYITALMPKSDVTSHGGKAAAGVILPVRGQCLRPARNFITVGRDALGAAGAFNYNHGYGSQRWRNVARSGMSTMYSATALNHGLMMRWD